MPGWTSSAMEPEAKSNKNDEPEGKALGNHCLDGPPARWNPRPSPNASYLDKPVGAVKGTHARKQSWEARPLCEAPPPSANGVATRLSLWCVGTPTNPCLRCGSELGETPR